MDAMLDMFFTGLALLVATFAFAFAYANMSWLPGPLVLPLFGNTLGFLGNDPYQTIQGWTKKYGKVYRMVLKGNHFFVFSDPDAIRQILASKSFNKQENREILTNFGMYKTGVVTNSDLDVWKLHRRMFKAAVQGQKLLDVVGVVSSEKADKLKDIWLSASCDTDEAGDKLVDVAKYFKLFSLDIIGQIALSRNFGAVDDGPENKIAKRALMMFKGFRYFAYTPTFIWKFIETTKTKEYLDNSAEMLKLETETLERARERLSSDTGATLEAAKDFPSSLVLQQAQESHLLGERGEDSVVDPLDDHHLAMDIRDMILAGTDTTSNSLTNIFYCLAKYPEEASKVRAEIEGTVPPSITDPEYCKSLSKLPYTDAFIKEAMRIYPVVANIGRVAVEDESVGGILVTKGTNVFLNVGAAAKDPSKVENPELFTPERWLNTVHAAALNKCVFSFGSGPRNCVGQHVAKIEMRACVARLLPQLEVMLRTPNQGNPQQYDLVNHAKDDSLILRFRKIA